MARVWKGQSPRALPRRKLPDMKEGFFSGSLSGGTCGLPGLAYLLFCQRFIWGKMVLVIIGERRKKRGREKSRKEEGGREVENQDEDDRAE